MNLFIKSYYFNNKGSKSLTDLVKEYNSKTDLINLERYIRHNSFDAVSNGVLGATEIAFSATMFSNLLLNYSNSEINTFTYILNGAIALQGAYYLARTTDYILAKRKIKKKLKTVE